MELTWAVRASQMFLSLVRLTPRHVQVEVAVKIARGAHQQKHSWASVMSELRIFRRLRHPSIVIFYGACVDPNSMDIALVLEHIAGQTCAPTSRGQAVSTLGCAIELPGDCVATTIRVRLHMQFSSFRLIRALLHLRYLLLLFYSDKAKTALCAASPLGDVACLPQHLWPRATTAQRLQGASPTRWCRLCAAIRSPLAKQVSMQRLVATRPPASAAEPS